MKELDCEHEWQIVPQWRIVNPNGEYVEGYGWDKVTISVNPEEATEFRCEKCKTLKRIDCEGQTFYYAPKLNPFATGR